MPAAVGEKGRVSCDALATVMRVRKRLRPKLAGAEGIGCLCAKETTCDVASRMVPAAAIVSIKVVYYHVTGVHHLHRYASSVYRATVPHALLVSASLAPPTGDTEVRVQYAVYWVGRRKTPVDET